MIALLLAPVCAGMILLTEPLLRVLFGSEYVERSAIVLQILAGAVFLNGLLFIPSALVEARGRPETVARYHLAEIPVYAAVLWFLVHRFGVSGAAAAWGLRMLWTTPLFYAVSMNAAGIDPRAPLRDRTGLAAAAGVLLIAGVAATVHLISASGLVYAAGVALIALFVSVAWPWLLIEPDRAAVRELFRWFSTST